MNRILLYPYHMRCASPKDICRGLVEQGHNSFRVFPDRDYRPKPTDLIINWGCSTAPTWRNPLRYPLTILNSWENVRNAVNKIYSLAIFRAMGISCPDTTITHADAARWLQEGNRVVGRQTVTGRAGRGILIMEPYTQLIECPLYTLYKPKRKEFRLHVFQDKVIDAQEKRRKKGGSNYNSKVRTHMHGWVFCHENVILPADAEKEAIASVKALGLDFGGVDLIWNEKENKSYVLEVNSAPGLEGSTIQKYIDEFSKLVTPVTN